ncbi:MAG: DNA methyltransferase [Bacteroidales bacterium]|nr:DNA methyltransferase [Bacteroidales bacterium]
MQNSLFPELDRYFNHRFPSTRYQGSKAKFVDWIWHELSGISFNTALDAFGGTGSVAYMLKDKGKAITYNDILPFNSIIGKALIENQSVLLDENDIEFILTEDPAVQYPTFIEDNFQDIYYTKEENHWLDIVRYNINTLDDEYKRAMAWFALFQSCIIKRPYNLFHRKNLYVRLMDVKRSFGNKKTWDTPFDVHFKTFAEEANRAVFDNGTCCRSTNMDALKIENEYDLIYIDTPYINEKGVGVDYADFYHFLNGMVNYDDWVNHIDYRSKHLRLKREYSIWSDKDNIINGFQQLIEHYNKSILVFSYRSNGIPSIESLVQLLERYGRKNEIRFSKEIKYALSETKTKEVLLISFPQSAL